ncbi:hypothetical protein QF037_000811 [Streptomyces canus]|nr:hypothetical protein [Streptomyces canus]
MLQLLQRWVLPGETRAHGFTAACPVGDRDGAGESVDHGPAAASCSAVQLGSVTIRFTVSTASAAIAGTSLAPRQTAQRPGDERLAPTLPHCSRPIVSLLNMQKSTSTTVDIGWRGGYGFSRSRDQAGPGRDELPGSSTRWCSTQDGAVVEFRSQGCCRTVTGLTTGPGGPQCSGAAASRTAVHASAVPDSAVRSTQQRRQVSSTSVKASAAGARTGRFGSGVLSQSRCSTGDGAGCRRVALTQATSSSHHQQDRAPRSTSTTLSPFGK